MIDHVLHNSNNWSIVLHCAVVNLPLLLAGIAINAAFDTETCTLTGKMMLQCFGVVMSEYDTFWTPFTPAYSVIIRCKIHLNSYCNHS